MYVVLISSLYSFHSASGNLILTNDMIVLIEILIIHYNKIQQKVDYLYPSSKGHCKILGKRDLHAFNGQAFIILTLSFIMHTNKMHRESKLNSYNRTLI